MFSSSPFRNIEQAHPLPPVTSYVRLAITHHSYVQSTVLEPCSKWDSVHYWCGLPFARHHNHNCRSWTIPDAAQIYQLHSGDCLVGSRLAWIDPHPIHCLTVWAGVHEVVLRQWTGLNITVKLHETEPHRRLLRKCQMSDDQPSCLWRRACRRGQRVTSARSHTSSYGYSLVTICNKANIGASWLKNPALICSQNLEYKEIERLSIQVNILPPP